MEIKVPLENEKIPFPNSMNGNASRKFYFPNFGNGNKNENSIPDFPGREWEFLLTPVKVLTCVIVFMQTMLTMSP